MNKKVPKIRFDSFSGEWERHKLSSMMNFSNGINAPKENYGKGRRMISVMDILSSGPLMYDDIRNSVEVSSNVENGNKVENGDLVFVRSSEIVEEVGWVKAYLDDRYALFSGFSIRGKKKNDFDSYFLQLSINGRNRFQIERKAGGSTRFNVNQVILNSLTITEPTFLEQSKIGNFFKLIDTTIALHQHELENLKRSKKAFLQKMFPKDGETVPEIRFPGFADEWEKSRLKKITNITTGKLDANAMIENGKYDFFTSGIKKYKINIPAFDGPAITIAGNGATVGYMHYADGKFNAYQRTYVLNNFRADRTFLYYEIKKKLPKKIKEEARTGNIPYIVMSMLTELNINIPGPKEQERIGLFFKQLDNSISLQQSKLEQLNKLKKAFLQKMFV